MRYKVELPPASAKRLEKDRRVIVEEVGAFHTYRQEFLIPDGVSVFEFDFTEEHDPEAEFKLDADVHYRYYLLYQNSTGTRQERTDFVPVLVDKA